MNVGFVGLGKLGFPTALAIETKGHTVFGSDPSPEVAQILRTRVYPYAEVRTQEFLARSEIVLLALGETVRRADLIFVTVQTPHDPRYEGVGRLPAERKDFDYSFLRAAMADLSAEIERLGEDRVVVLVSTVLPGTIRREIIPVLGPHTKLCYNPFFIAMGTTIADFLGPEFVLFGVEDDAAAERAQSFYRTIHGAPFYRTSLENAELIKVIYNTFISTKIAFANTVMEICHKLPGTNVDAVIGALKLATQRIISPRYLDGGMGDGGGCHPRDNIALSNLSRQLGMRFDWFEGIMMQRETQTDWLADLVEEHSHGRPLVILGKSFKPETNIVVGSPALLLRNLLEERGHAVLAWDPYIDQAADLPVGQPTCYFIGTKHPQFQTFPFEKGSVVLDPWRYIADCEKVTVIRIGE